jgi:hypothetical protein
MGDKPLHITSHVTLIVVYALYGVLLLRGRAFSYLVKEVKKAIPIEVFYYKTSAAIVSVSGVSWVMALSYGALPSLILSAVHHG